MSRAARGQPGYWAFLLHRLSGLALALFLPLHFIFLGLALENDGSFDNAIAWTQRTPVKAAEWLLVVLLALHLAGGARVLAVEFLPWFGRQGAWIAASAGFALAAGGAFLWAVA